MNRYFGAHTLEGEWHSLLPRYLLLADRVRGKRVLDIGCGTGIGSSLLLELGAAAVDGIDHRPAVLEIGRMKHAKNGLDFHVMFWEELDFPDNAFDIVLCLDPASPVTDPSLMSEVRRVLRDSGEYICSIERTKALGMESLLPKYGYADAAESIDVHPHLDRVPQVIDLSTTFPQCFKILQRPALSFVFDYEVANDQATRRENRTSEDSGVWVPALSGENGRWLTTDRRLLDADENIATVELWFCGSESMEPAPLREIALPYFTLTRRLEQALKDLLQRQVDPLGDGVFTDVLDDAPATRERQITSEFKVVSFDDADQQLDDLGLDEPTNVRREGNIENLGELYHRVQDDFSGLLTDAKKALVERDEYIAHLVSTVHTWEERFKKLEQDSTEKPSDAETVEPPEKSVAKKTAAKAKKPRKKKTTATKSDSAKAKSKAKPKKATPKKATKKSPKSKDTEK